MYIFSGVEHATCIVSHVQLPRASVTSSQLAQRQRKTCVVRPSPAFPPPHIMCAKTVTPGLPVPLEKDASVEEKKEQLMMQGTT